MTAKDLPEQNPARLTCSGLRGTVIYLPQDKDILSVCWNRWLHRVAGPLFACFFLGLIALAAPAPDTSAGALASEQVLQPSQENAPQKARDLLRILQDRQGVPLPGYVGGRDFKNRERRLPPGRYREYDVNPKIRGRSRDAERIVIEQRTGKAYYTGDHYRSFTPLN
ncbi:ribonuclease domain-containing protein [Nitrospira sp. NS4]|uniref:ribonuclease domain-containing protein n=1 Tax=Nitrospira sp. NS4 TaxID=3414498 RepID=UPI003C2C5BC1